MMGDSSPRPPCLSCRWRSGRPNSRGQLGRCRSGKRKMLCPPASEDPLCRCPPPRHTPRAASSPSPSLLSLGREQPEPVLPDVLQAPPLTMPQLIPARPRHPGGQRHTEERARGTRSNPQLCDSARTASSAQVSVSPSIKQAAGRVVHTAPRLSAASGVRGGTGRPGATDMRTGTTSEASGAPPPKRPVGPPHPRGWSWPLGGPSPCPTHARFSLQPGLLASLLLIFLTNISLDPH